MAAENQQHEGLLQQAGAIVASVYRAVFRDGTLDAFLRQGANELGTALKAFPDSIQVDEPGAAFSPLYSDIAADKRERMYGAEKEGPANGRIASLSEIMNSPSPSPPEQGRGQEMDHGREM